MFAVLPGGTVRIDMDSTASLANAGLRAACGDVRRASTGQRATRCPKGIAVNIARAVQSHPLSLFFLVGFPPK